MVMMMMMIAVIELTVTAKRRPHRYLPNALAALDKLYKNSSGDEIANVNFFLRRHRICTAQRLRPLNRLPIFYYNKASTLI